MTRLRTLFAAALLSTGLAGAALAQGLHDHGSLSGKDTDSMGSMKPDPKDDASTKAFKAADMAMMKDMDVPYTGDADVDFRTHMIPHHKGAVAMAKVALKHAKDPATKAMAQTIIDDQEKEIADMQAWLKRHGK
ncbi:CopM family metallochaperone [Methylobacterium sp. P5_C11]